MAEEQYAVYTQQYGYPPSQPYHLISFAKKNGASVTYTAARKLIAAAKANAKLNKAVIKEFSADKQQKKVEATTKQTPVGPSTDEVCASVLRMLYRVSHIPNSHNRYLH